MIHSGMNPPANPKHMEMYFDTSSSSMYVYTHSVGWYKCKDCPNHIVVVINGKSQSLSDERFNDFISRYGSSPLTLNEVEYAEILLRFV